MKHQDTVPEGTILARAWEILYPSLPGYDSKKHTLGELASGLDNNLNLIRMIAAIAVLVSHAWPIALGPGATEPLNAAVGMSLGELAVITFFVVSGFLVSSSYARSASLSHFILARSLRIFPGLVVSLLLVAFLMGPAVTNLPHSEYFRDAATWSFVSRNIMLASPQYTLPGVFSDNPYPTVEGSIWTLFHEVACYLGVVIIGIAGLYSRPFLLSLAMGLFLVGSILIGQGGIDVHPKIESFMSLAPAFIIGMAFYVWRARLVLRFSFVMFLAILAAFSKSTPAWSIVMVTAIAYTTFWLAYIPGGVVRAYNKVGDYSYGIYIYAFPLQGLVIHLYGQMSPAQNIYMSLAPTLALALISWHMIEKPALQLRRRYLL